MVLLKSCQRDIVDLFPSEQKLLTDIAWDCVAGSSLTEGRSPAVHHNMILAHTFQGMKLNTETVLDRIRADDLLPDIGTHHLLLDHLCRLDSKGKLPPPYRPTVTCSLP